MAKAMVRKAIADRIPFRWVTADAVYGYSKGWRFELKQADVFHVMATNRHDTVVTRWALDHPVQDLFPSLPRQKWKRRSCGEGAHGRRIHDWARVEVRPWNREDRRHWVIARRSVSRPEEISYYIAYCPSDTRLDQLICVAGSRWASLAEIGRLTTRLTDRRPISIDHILHCRHGADDASTKPAPVTTNDADAAPENCPAIRTDTVAVLVP